MGRVEQHRHLVTARAAGGCEYCRLMEEGTGNVFQLDHVVPTSRGGTDGADNLALSCPRCNRAKRNHIAGHDDLGREQLLFNPRRYDSSSLGWLLHFRLEPDTGVIVPIDPCGQATVRRLQMNERRRIFARRLQLRIGILS